MNLAAVGIGDRNFYFARRVIFAKFIIDLPLCFLYTHFRGKQNPAKPDGYSTG